MGLANAKLQLPLFSDEDHQALFKTIVHPPCCKPQATYDFASELILGTRFISKYLHAEGKLT
jgi:hypothetical protein